jgi:hypothetical protein
MKMWRPHFLGENATGCQYEYRRYKRGNQIFFQVTSPVLVTIKQPETTTACA